MPKILRPTPPLADVNVLSRPDGSLEVVACFMPDPDMIVGEGVARAFIALDGSSSMKEMYGKGISPLFPAGPNFVEMVARKLGGILCPLTNSGKAAACYWAVGADGGMVEGIGEFDQAGWAVASVPGPRAPWGRNTQILPAIRHAFEDVAAGADWTMGVIITDGFISDETEARDYCMAMGREIADGQRKPVKLVLIGVGKEVHADQLERFDDMFEGTDLQDRVDLWSHGLASSFEDENDILAVLYGELMSESVVVAPSGRVEDALGNPIATWNDGLPGQMRFVLPPGVNAFVVKTPHLSVAQDLTEVFAKP